MNKIQVGNVPSPNLKTVQSKVGSMANASYKPGGGNVKIESRKIQIEAKSRVGARNEGYVKAGGDKKVRVSYDQVYVLSFTWPITVKPSDSLSGGGGTDKSFQLGSITFTKKCILNGKLV